jgi:hypothetical protein
MNVTDKAEFEACFILPEHCTLVLTEQVATVFRYVDLNALGTQQRRKMSYQSCWRARRSHGRMPASVTAGDHGFESPAKFLSELVFARSYE